MLVITGGVTSPQINVIVLSVEVDALFVFQAGSATTHAHILAVTVSPSVIPVTVNSKLVSLLGATCDGPEVTDPLVPERVISEAMNVAKSIGSSKTTLKVALFTEVGSD